MTISQAVQRLLDQVSDAHKSISFSISQLLAYTEDLELKMRAMAPILVSEKRQRAYILELRQTIDQSKLNEIGFVKTIENLKDSVTSERQESERLLVSGERFKKDIKSLQSKLNASLLSNEKFVCENGELSKKLKDARSKTVQVCSYLREVKKEIVHLVDGEEGVAKVILILKERLAKAQRSEEAMLNLQKASDSENLMLYKQLQEREVAHRSAVSAHRSAEDRIILLEADLLTMRRDVDDAQKQLKLLRDR